MKRRTIIGMIFIVAALLRLATLWGIWQLDWMWHHPWSSYFGVFLVLYLGVELVASSYESHPDQWLSRPLPIGDEGKRICCSVRFGGDKYAYHGETFHGARIDAFCGGIRLDLREALITEDEEIDIHTFLGGVQLFVPQGVRIETKSRSFIGSVDNHVPQDGPLNSPCLHIIASNVMGGVSIKTND